MMLWPSNLVSSATRVVAPRRCLGCSVLVNDGALFCASCLEWVEELPSVWTLGVPRPLATLHVGFEYAGVVKDAILDLKHGGRTVVGFRLGEYLARRIPPRRGIVVPVPLHPLRLRVRGYNQSMWIARGLCRGRPELTICHALRRVGGASSQKGHGRTQRREAVSEAFSPTRLASRVAGQDVWLVDDVWVTGATLSACAVALKKAGARRLRGLVSAAVT